MSSRSNASGVIMFGPSLGAASGSSCTSTKRRVDADGGRGPRERQDELALAARRVRRARPGCCTLWVASKTTG